MLQLLESFQAQTFHTSLGMLFQGRRKEVIIDLVPVLLQTFSYLILRQDCERSIEIPILTDKKSKFHRHNLSNDTSLVSGRAQVQTQ